MTDDEATERDERELGAELRRAFPAEDLEPADEQVAVLRDHVLSVRRRPSRSRWRMPIAAAALVVAGAGIGVGAATWISSDDDLLARGSDEFVAELTGPAGVVVDLDGDAAPEGRIVTLRSDSLPVIGYEEFYELWFLTDEGDTTWVSAGTFHPDDEGNTVVVLHVAIDPSVVTDIQVTREPRDDDPTPSGEVVARGPVDLLE